MKLSRTVVYAVRATVLLAQQPTTSPVPCSKLADLGQMPERFLLQVLRQLVTQGVLRSTRGIDGGYSLDRKADATSLLEVIEAVDGPLGSMARNQQDGDGPPSATEERLREVLSLVMSAARRQLKTVTLADMASVKPVAKLLP